MTTELSIEVLEAVSWPHTVGMMVIDDQLSYEDALAMLKQIKANYKMADRELISGKQKTYDAYQDALARYNRYTKPCLEAEIILKDKCKIYLKETAAKEKKVQEEYQVKLIAQEKARIDAEKKAASSTSKTGTDKPVPGKPAEVPVVEPPPILTPKTNIKGVQERYKWKPEIVDHAALLGYVKDHAGAYEEQIEKAFMPWLRKHATANGESMPIPGVRFEKEPEIAVK